jgi:hypothetical protein
MSKPDKSASRMLVSFVRSYTDLLEKNLAAVRETMSETVDGVMTGIQQISDATEKKKKQANEVLVTTYTNPTEEAKATMDSVQDEVNRILDSAGLGEAAPAPALKVVESAPDEATPESEELRSKLRRSSGLFSKHMEALETLDDELQTLLLSMMGMLSRDDVIKQRIEHVAEALQALQMSLGYMLVDFETRCRPEGIERFVRDLKAYLMRSYTTEEEKALHFEAFPEDRKAS